MNCPKCNDTRALQLFTSVECANPYCENFAVPAGGTRSVEERMASDTKWTSCVEGCGRKTKEPCAAFRCKLCSKSGKPTYISSFRPDFLSRERCVAGCGMERHVPSGEVPGEWTCSRCKKKAWDEATKAQERFWKKEAHELRGLSYGAVYVDEKAAPSESSCAARGEPQASFRVTPVAKFKKSAQAEAQGPSCGSLRTVTEHIFIKGLAMLLEADPPVGRCGGCGKDVLYYQRACDSCGEAAKALQKEMFKR